MAEFRRDSRSRCRRACCSPASAARRARSLQTGALRAVTDPAAAATHAAARLRDPARPRPGGPARDERARRARARRAGRRRRRRSDHRRRRPRRGPPRRRPRRAGAGLAAERDHGAGRRTRAPVAASTLSNTTTSRDRPRRPTRRTRRSSRRRARSRSAPSVRASVRCGWNARASASCPSGASRAADLACHAGERFRAFAEAEPQHRGRAAPSGTRRHRRAAREPVGTVSAFERAPDRIDVGAVAEELQRHVPLRRASSRRTRRRSSAGCSASTSSSTRLGRDDRDERRVTVHVQALGVTRCRGTARCPRDPASRSSGSRRRRSDPRPRARRAERDEPLGFALDVGADDEVEVHPVLDDLAFRHLLEHELRPVTVGGHDRPVGRCRSSRAARSRAPRCRSRPSGRGRRSRC